MKRYLVAVVGVQGSPAESQRSEVGTYRSESAARQAGEDEWRRILFVHAPHVDRYRVVIERDGSEVGEVPMPEVPADAGPGLLDETVTPLGVPLGAAGEPIEPEVADEVEVADEPGGDAEPQPPVQAEAVGVAAVAAVADDGDPPPPPLEATGEMDVITDDDPVDAAITGQQPVVRNDDIEALDEQIDEIKIDMPVPTADVAMEVEADVAPPQTSYLIEDPPDGPVPDDIIARFAESLRLEDERNAERAERERGRGN